jgi:hypothetical protein
LDRWVLVVVAKNVNQKEIEMKVPKKLSELLFAIFMILLGIEYLAGFPLSGPILGMLAIVIGVLKFMGK